MGPVRAAWPSAVSPGNRHRRIERGAAAVEFALVAPLLILLVFGLIDFGFMVNRDTMINNASREGAREGALNPNAAEIRAVVLSDLPGLAPADVTVTTTCRKPDDTACVAAVDTEGESGGVVVVTVHYDYRWITPVGRLFGATIALEKQTEMRIE